MSVADAIRAWKDEDYLMSLSDHDRASLPENPAGDVRLDLDLVKSSRGISIRHCSIVIECSASNCG